MLIQKNNINFSSKSFLFLILMHANISFSSSLNNQALQVVGNIFGITSPAPASPAKSSAPSDNTKNADSSNATTTITNNETNVAQKTENTDLGIKKDILSQQPIALASSPLDSIGSTVSNVFNLTSDKSSNLKSPTNPESNIINIDAKKDILSQSIQPSTNTPVAVIGNSPTVIQNAPGPNITNSQSAVISKVEENAVQPAIEISNQPISSSTPNVLQTASSQGISSQPTLSAPSSKDRSSARRKNNNNPSLIVIDENRKSSQNLKVLDEPNVVQKNSTDALASIPQNSTRNLALQASQNVPVVLPSDAIRSSQTIQTGPESVQLYANHVTNQTTEYRDDLIRIKNKIKTVKKLLNRATIEGINQSVKIQAGLQNELATNEMNIDNTLKEITLALNESNQLIANNSQTNSQDISYISKISSELTIQQQLLNQCKKDNTELLKTLNESIVLTKKAQESLKPQIEAYDKASELNDNIYKNLKQANTAVSKSVKPVYSMTSLFGTQNAMISCHKKNRTDCLIRDQHCIWLKTEQECSLKCNAITSEEACNKVGDGLLCAWNIRGDKGYCYHKY